MEIAHFLVSKINNMDIVGKEIFNAALGYNIKSLLKNIIFKIDFLKDNPQWNIPGFADAVSIYNNELKIYIIDIIDQEKSNPQKAYNILYLVLESYGKPFIQYLIKRGGSELIKAINNEPNHDSLIKDLLNRGIKFEFKYDKFILTSQSKGSELKV